MLELRSDISGHLILLRLLLETQLHSPYCSRKKKVFESGRVFVEQVQIYLSDVVTSHRTVCVTEDLWARLTSFWRGRNAYDQNILTKNVERSRDSSIITLREQHSRLSCILGLVPVTAEGWLSTLSMEISAWYHFEIRLYFGVYSFLYKIIRLEQQIFSRLQNWQHSTLLSINVFIFRLLSTRVNPLIGADTVPLRPAAPVFDIRRQTVKQKELGNK